MNNTLTTLRAAQRELAEIVSGMNTRAINNVTVKSSTLEMFAGEVSEQLRKIDALIASMEAQPEQKPVWYACDTEGAEFDVTFVTTRDEAADAVDCALADDPDLKFEDLVTPLYTHAPPSEPKAEPARLTDAEIYEAYAALELPHVPVMWTAVLGTVRAIERHLTTAAPAAKATAETVKDHVIREVVNNLRDVAIQYHATQQLRSRIQDAIAPLFAAPTKVAKEGYGDAIEGGA